MVYKYWEIEIDGPDKTGKDLLCRYLCELSNWRFSINVRGLISQLVYAKKFNRDYQYVVDTTSTNKHKIFIILYGDEDDIDVRCKMTNEPKYNIKDDLKLFFEAVDDISVIYPNIHVFNTSHMTPYDIAKKVIKLIDKLEEQN